MRAPIRFALVISLVAYFGLMPETTYSLYQDSRSQLSNWHPSDEVPHNIWHLWDCLSAHRFMNASRFLRDLTLLR